MVTITLDLLRKRAEHNEGEISTLEEIALHQENIDKIETLNGACRDLKILLMQNNLIGRIENLNMLKRLVYLNLALNNIKVIENLEGLESLRKLDLTVNFIADARDVQRLRRNENLEILYLTGNPCTDWDGYREYVVATLTGLKELDSTEIERSERILAVQNYARARDDVARGYREYTEGMSPPRTTEQASDDNVDEDDRVSKFWNSKSLHTPEERIAIAEMSERRERKREQRGSGDTRAPPRLSSPGGTPYNVNRAKVSFRLDDETDPENLLLDIRLRRYTDPSHVEAEVGPTYARVAIKGKLLQVRLPCEVSVAGSVAERNATTGVLAIKMPRLEPLPLIRQSFLPPKPETKETFASQQRRRQLLEIGPTREELDFSRICRGQGAGRRGDSSNDFVDDPLVPPLE